MLKSGFRKNLKILCGRITWHFNRPAWDHPLNIPIAWINDHLYRIITRNWVITRNQVIIALSPQFRHPSSSEAAAARDSEPQVAPHPRTCDYSKRQWRQWTWASSCTYCEFQLVLVVGRGVVWVSRRLHMLFVISRSTFSVETRFWELLMRLKILNPLSLYCYYSITLLLCLQSSNVIRVFYHGQFMVMCWWLMFGQGIITFYYSSSLKSRYYTYSLETIRSSLGVELSNGSFPNPVTLIPQNLTNSQLQGLLFKFVWLAAVFLELRLEHTRSIYTIQPWLVLYLLYDQSWDRLCIVWMVFCRFKYKRILNLPSDSIKQNTIVFVFELHNHQTCSL